MESWRLTWREGVAPCLSTPALVALRAGLAADDPRLIQGATTTPPPLMAAQDWPVEAAEPLAFAGWQGEGLATVGEVEKHFAETCLGADARLGEPAASRWFLNWWDDTPRAEAVRELLAEVDLALAGRAAPQAAAGTAAADETAALTPEPPAAGPDAAAPAAVPAGWALLPGGTTRYLRVSQYELPRAGGRPFRVSEDPTDSGAVYAEVQVLGPSRLRHDPAATHCGTRAGAAWLETAAALLVRV